MMSNQTSLCTGRGSFAVAPKPNRQVADGAHGESSIRRTTSVPFKKIRSPIACSCATTMSSSLDP